MSDITREAVIVCGGRDFRNYDQMEEVLVRELELEDLVIHGEARGADQMAASIAGLLGNRVVGFPAKWDQFGKRAGFLRNEEMLTFASNLAVSGKVDGVRVIAFPGGVGTKMMMDLARRADVEVLEVAVEYGSEVVVPSGITRMRF